MNNMEYGTGMDVAFILDGTLPPIDFDATRKFICDVSRDLSADQPLARFACIVYGEYSFQFPGARKWHSDYDVIILGFSSFPDLVNFINGVAPLSFPENDPSDALELGLSKANYLEWANQIKELVLIGHSPPHPNAQERRQYQLPDRTVEEFDLSIHWRSEADKLKNIQDISLTSIWIDPNASQMPAKDLKFAKYIWEQLGTHAILDDIGLANRRKLVLSIMNRCRHLERNNR